MKRYSFDRGKRLRKSREFAQVQNTGRRLSSKHFLILVSPGSGSRNKLGITITRKVDSRAVYRNRLKRRLREIFRVSYQALRGPFDIVIIARKNAAECEMSDIRREILGTLKHAGLLEKEDGNDKKKRMK